MVQSDGHGPLGQGVVRHGDVCAVSVSGRVVRDGLCDAVEKEPGSDAASEKHHEPGDVVEFRLLSRLAQTDARVLAEVQADDEHGPYVLAADVKPGVPMHDLSLPRVEGNGIRCRNAPAGETPDQDDRREGDHRVEPDPSASEGTRTPELQPRA